MTHLNHKIITQQLPDQLRKIYIAYSGGIDSQVLLHLCVTASNIKDKIIAVYINHGLQNSANDWGQHCRNQCRDFDVEFKLIKVDARANDGESPEAAARSARYSALKTLLEADDVILVAQHREDQLETVLLQLFRGGGIQGLSAMPVSMTFGKGLLLRPLLNIPKLEIQSYAIRQGLQWVEDPSNLSDDFDRNFLRNQVLPLLKIRWSGLDKTVARTAKHCANASDLLNEWGEQSLQLLLDPLDYSLLIDKWKLCKDKQKNWLLRTWLQRFGLQPPSEAVLKAIIEQVIHARDDASPQVYLQGYSIRKYRQKLFCLVDDYLRVESDIKPWRQSDEGLLMQNGFWLQRIPSASGIDKRLWQTHAVTISRRCGGEKIKLSGRDGLHCLKKLYQEAGVPPWERELRPLIFLDDRLAAVAGLWVAEWAWLPMGDCYKLLWQANPVKV